MCRLWQRNSGEQDSTRVQFLFAWIGARFGREKAEVRGSFTGTGFVDWSAGM